MDTIKGSLLCVLQNISFMLPVYMLYCLVSDMHRRARSRPTRIPFYAAGTRHMLPQLILGVYVVFSITAHSSQRMIETGVRRIGLAEKLRRIPLSFFGKKDLADLTSAIMNDCAVLETSQFAPYLSAHRRDNINNAYCDFAVLYSTGAWRLHPCGCCRLHSA